MIEKAQKSGESTSELDDKLTYINNFPLHWKYVSLFASNGEAV